jgi:hypothetical protein
MMNRLVGITIDCADPAQLASFWSRMLSIAETDEHADDSGWATRHDPQGHEFCIVQYNVS